jgi:hypothetical protein
VCAVLSLDPPVRVVTVVGYFYVILFSKGARQNHTICGLKKAAYSKKLFANNLENIMTVLHKNITQKHCNELAFFTP